ncbi:MAG: protease modulator HflC [Clostridiales bacterium]|jgi:membrane protease subunit HflC|nr:protease modulator HflC [Clostridiales bacterium]
MEQFNNQQNRPNYPPRQPSKLNEALKNFARKNTKLLVIIGILLIAAFILLNEAFFIVGEAEQAVVSRFGVIKSIILDDQNTFHERFASQLSGEITAEGGTVVQKRGSGLHFKVPFVDKVDKFPSLLFNYTSNSETVNTSEKKQYNITTYAQWRIADPALFSLKLGSTMNAENQLDNLIHPVIVQAINRLLAEDFISNKEALNNALKNGLVTINQDMVIRGIEVTDIQVHRTILPQANVETTYDRMKADRAKVAQQLRSEGDETYRKMVSDTDLKAAEIEADAIKTAGETRATADAAAMDIYNQAYKADPEFYQFWRSLEALRGSFKDNSTLVLSQDHLLWQQLLTWGLGIAE